MPSKGFFVYLHQLLGPTPGNIQLNGCEFYGGETYGCGTTLIRGTELTWKVGETI